MSHSARESLTRWTRAAIDWVYNRSDRETVIIGALVLVAVISLGIALLTRSSTTNTPPSDIRDRADQPRLIRFTNDSGGYRFEYPETWEIRQEGSLSRLQSPNGRILLSFGVTHAHGLDTAASRLASSLSVSPGRSESIGTSRESIAGARALLKSGTTLDPTGRPIRYLAIAIDGRSITYTISITVPSHADPEQVLLDIERIVSSFGASGGSFV